MSVALAGRPIVITGASSGIGRAAALACARAGMPVALGARRADRLDVIVREIESIGGRAVSVATDVTSAEQCLALVERAADAFGSVYAVFANAGHGADAPILSMTDEQIRAIYETNFFGTLNAIRPAVERMRGNDAPPRGHVLICSSCVARLTIPNLGAYSATKASQAHVGAAMRHELADDRIYVSTVHPVGVATEFFGVTPHVGVEDARRHRSPRAFTQSADLVARHVVRCLRRPRPEVWTGPPGAVTRFSAALMTLSPRFADFIARRSVKR